MSVFSKIRGVAYTAVAIVSISVAAHASTYTPVGPQNDVLKSTVTDGGWTQVYSGVFGESVAYNTMFNNLSDWVMIASAEVGSNTFDLLATIRVADFNALATGRNVTETHNGAEWYRNARALGFAPEGATISQNSADVTDRFAGPTRDQRMSWHTSGTGGYNGTPTTVNVGWRSGENTSLNSSTTWQRFVLTASTADLTPAPVPVPASLPLLLAGLVGFGAIARRRKTAA